jgi:hypothetical protein
VLKTKTVFVLGAGASVPFGFPTGVGLTELMLKDLRERGRIYDMLRTGLSLNADALDNFATSLYNSGKNSVDAFLEHRQEFMDIGKAAIASSLIPFEIQDKVMDFGAGNWLRYMYNQLNSGFDDFPENRISFITFNYDRTVEWFLANSLQNSFGRTIDECKKVLDSIPVVHLHGRLGYLPWENAHGRDFGSTLDRDNVRASVDQIKIIHEDIDDNRDSDFKKAKLLLESAEKIYFMGFGFNKLNVDRLGLSGLQPNKSIATAFGLTTNEIGFINKMTNGKILFENRDCINLCRERVAWN